MNKGKAEQRIQQDAQTIFFFKGMTLTQPCTKVRHEIHTNVRQDQVRSFSIQGREPTRDPGSDVIRGEV